MPIRVHPLVEVLRRACLHLPDIRKRSRMIRHLLSSHSSHRVAHQVRSLCVIVASRTADTDMFYSCLTLASFDFNNCQPGFQGDRNWNNKGFEFSHTQKTGSPISLLGRSETSRPILTDDIVMAVSTSSYCSPLTAYQRGQTRVLAQTDVILLLCGYCGDS